MPLRRDAAHEAVTAETAAQESGAGQPGRSSSVEVSFLVCLGLVVLSFLWQLWSLPAFGQGGTVGPGLYPLGLASILFLLLLLRAGRLVASTLSARHEAAADSSAGVPEAGIITSDQLVLLAFIVASILIGYWSGLFVAVGLFLLGALVWVERVSTRAALVFTAGMLVAVYLIFDLWLGMNVGLRGLF